MNVREMYNYGYKWTGMIPLTAEEARNLFLNDSIQIYRLYQDNTESSVESLEEISAPYLYGIEKLKRKCEMVSTLFCIKGKSWRRSYLRLRLLYYFR